MPDETNSQAPGAIFMGYLAREIVRGDEYRSRAPDQDPRIEEICSVSACISAAFRDYDRWAFNDAGCYPTEQAALEAVPPERRAAATIFAYRLFLLEFTGGESTVVSIEDLLDTGAMGTLPDEPSARFKAIGFDVVSGRRAVAATPSTAPMVFGVDCSPLSCSGLSSTYQINRFCLLPAYADAVAAARDISRDEPEPGPYYIVEVLRAAT